MATTMSAPPSRPTSNPQHERRRFRLLDAMILVAATAVACSIALWIVRESGVSISRSEAPAENVAQSEGTQQDVGNVVLLLDLFLLVGALALPFFAMWTLAIVPLRLLSPRPRFRRLARQPGTMAAIAASLGIAIAIVQIACMLLTSVFPSVNDPLFVFAVSGGVASIATIG
jgi:hypothetical protein